MNLWTAYQSCKSSLMRKKKEGLQAIQNWDSRCSSSQIVSSLIPSSMDQPDKPASLEGEGQEWEERREQVEGERRAPVEDVGG